MSQPVWKLLANLGDVHPVDHGGAFVYLDTTGVYAPEMEMLFEPEDEDEHGRSSGGWRVHRFPLDRCTHQEFGADAGPSSGYWVLSDNAYHPEMAAWFCPTAQHRRDRPQDSHLGQVADACDRTEAELMRLLCSEDPLERADAYRAIGDYHGYENFDAYPLVLHTRKEVERRYATAHYLVTTSMLGNVYSGPSRLAALRAYRRYRGAFKGAPEGKHVALYADGEVRYEWSGDVG